jgi:hypothetical protein
VRATSPANRYSPSVPFRSMATTDRCPLSFGSRAVVQQSNPPDGAWPMMRVCTESARGPRAKKNYAGLELLSRNKTVKRSQTMRRDPIWSDLAALCRLADLFSSGSPDKQKHSSETNNLSP